MRPAPAFLADAMLGRLARWLRVLGYDTRFDPSIDDPELAELAREENRVLLTRDRGLARERAPDRAVLIAARGALDQLQEVARVCELGPPPELFRRCQVCNTRLREASQEEVAALVPPRAREAGAPFLRCPGCGRAYWHGTHVQRMQEALAKRFPEWFQV